MERRKQRNKKLLAVLIAVALIAALTIPALAAGQTVYLKGSGGNFNAGGWQNLFYLGGAEDEADPNIWHLVYTGNNFGAVTSMQITFTNGEVFSWTSGMGPSTNGGGNNPGWVILAPADWSIAYVNSGNNNQSESYLVTEESGNINFNISGFHRGCVEPPKGSLEITKSFKINGQAADAPEGFYAEFTVTGPNGFSATLVYPDDLVNGKLTLSDLTPGTYNVTENTGDDASGFSWTVTGDGNVTVSSGQKATKNITNSHDDVYGSLEITKAFNINGEAADAPEGFYAEFTVTGPNGFSATLAYPDDLVNGKLTLDNLRPGAYNVSEDTDDDGSGFSWFVTGAGEVTVVADQKATVSILNSHDDGPGNIEIFKSFSIDGESLPAPEGFRAEFTVTGDDYEVTLVYPDDLDDIGRLFYGELRAGAYNVSENVLSDGGIAWTAYGTGEVTVTRGQTETVNVTNTFYNESYPTSLTIRKSFSGSFTANSIPRSWSAHFVVRVDGEIYDEFDMTAEGPFEKTYSGWEMPVGVYTVVETGGSISGYNWRVEYTQANGVEVNEGSAANLDVVNYYWTTTEPEPGRLVVTKAFNISNIPNSWSATVSVTGPGGYSQSRTITGSNRTVSFDGLEPGSYTVTEIDPSGIPNYTFLNVAGEGSYDVTRGSTTNATITNRYEEEEPPPEEPPSEPPEEMVLFNEEVPLAEFPPEEEIDDIEVPLAEMPQTGIHEALTFWVFALCASLAAVGVVTVIVKKANNKKD